MRKIVLCILIAGGLLWAIKALFVGGGITMQSIRQAAITDVVLFFEILILASLMAGFIAQEILSMAARISSPNKAGHHAKGARWLDLLYLFAAAFGSGFLFVALARVAAP
jgi:hypothetical protein